MQAVLMTAVGTPEVLLPSELPEPTLATPTQLKVRLHAAGWKVRVLPDDTGSSEANPPTFGDFVTRDLRWAGGNMQYLALLRLPGFDIKELFLPVGMASLNIDFADGYNLEMFYQYDWEPFVVDPAGSFFSTNNFATNGASFVMLGFGTVPQPVNNPERFFATCFGGPAGFLNTDLNYTNLPPGSYVFEAIGANLYILDTDLRKLQLLEERGFRAHTIVAHDFNIAKAVKRADVLVGAVLIPGARAPHIVTRDMVRTMKPRSVIIDVSIDQGGCVETSRPTTYQSPTYIEEGVIHYCVPNMTGVVARTTTHAFNNAAWPYILEIARKGLMQALEDNPALMRGLNVHEGKIVHPALRESLGGGE